MKKTQCNDVFEAFITLIKRHPSFGNYTNATESANYYFKLKLTK